MLIGVRGLPSSRSLAQKVPMNALRKWFAVMAVVALGCGAPGASAAQPNPAQPPEVLLTWYELILELVRHTPTYSPPVASRSLAYLGVTAFEAVATGLGELKSLAGQLNGLEPVPQRTAGKSLRRSRGGSRRDGLRRARPFRQHRPDRPAGHGARSKRNCRRGFRQALPADVVARSEAHGKAVAAHIPGLVARRRRRGHRKHGLPAASTS